ncbi:hypothetical protein B566_EDAN005336 [Ephemera danica]|nr:hypothetical protein B566_EDAN005336 [Ephemera danica]
MFTCKQSFLLCLWILANVFCVTSSSFQSTLGHIKTRTDPNVQSSAVGDLVKRLLDDKADLFDTKVDPSLAHDGKDVFVIQKTENDTKVLIRGSSGIAVAWGLNHYLKYFCNCQVNWEHHQQLKLPTILPNVNLTITSQDRFRYYQNVCTLSYSFAWWKWPQWERHLDWMALNGINLPLAFVGQEAIWEKVYSKLGLNHTEIADHFTGPAFFAWGRMGNIRGWGGPLPMSWHSQTLELQHKILARMREFGMTPVLPAFAGHVPRALVRIYPHANFTKMGDWNDFEDKYCCPYLLSPEDAAFHELGSLFMKEARWSKTGCLFMRKSTGVKSELKLSLHPFQLLMQGWLFLSGFWTLERAKALLTSVPQGRMVVLDLQSELSEQYTKFHSYFGQPFIWCMLHNFGGTLGLYGAADLVNKGVFHGRTMPNSTMVGTGITPEGINQNYVIYDLMLEMGWRNSPANLTIWFNDYATRRYGIQNSNATEAWQLLKNSVYNFNDSNSKIRGKYIMCRRPSLKLKPVVWYNASDVMVAWDHLMSVSHHIPTSGTLQHDLVDVGRQSLQLMAAYFYTKIVLAYRKKDIVEFRQYSTLMLRLLTDLDILLSSSPDFLLGSWTKSARSWGTTKQESELYEWNARNQISLWGPRGEILDYANKQWAGVMMHYFKPRWQLFIQHLNQSLTEGVAFNQAAFNKQVFEQVELPFTMDKTVFADEPQEDPLITAQDVHKRWRPLFKKSATKSLTKKWRTLNKSKSHLPKKTV